MKHLSWIICAVLWLGLTTVSAFAQEDDLVTRTQPLQELFLTRLVYPQGRGEIQFSSISRFSKGKDHSSLQTPLSLEYGITHRWQIEIESDVMSRRSKTGEATTRGRGDISIGTQYSFMNMRHSNFHSAVGFELTLPTGNLEKGLSEGFIEYAPYFLVAKDFPKLNNMQIFSQVGMGFVQQARRKVAADEEAAAAHKFDLGVGMFVPFRHLVLTGEFNLSTNRWNNNGREREITATPGFVWRLPLNWEVGFGAPVGLTSDADKFGAILRLVYELSTRRSTEAP